MTRDGPEYGVIGPDLEGKVSRLLRQLESEEARFSFAPETGTVNVVATRELRGAATER